MATPKKNFLSKVRKPRGPSNTFQASLASAAPTKPIVMAKKPKVGKLPKTKIKKLY